MPFQRPALREIIERIEQDVISRLGSGTPARNALTRVLARANAGLAHGLYGYIDTKEKNFLPDTGDEAAVLRWANLLGVPRLSAVAAAGTVQATGSNGAVIPQGRVLQTTGGVQYTVDEDATVSAGVALVSVTAVERGAAGNVAAGQAMAFLSPIVGVVASTVVQAPGITGGADLETIDALRVRVLDRMQRPSKGGALSDYVDWAKAAHPDVTRVWPSGQEISDNSVTVRIVTDDASGGMIPTEGVLSAVSDYIASRRPVTAEIYVVAPTPVDLDMTLAINPDTTAVREAITAELEDMIKREATPGGTILLSRIKEAISTAAGEADHALSVPSADVTHDTGEIAVLGTITWSAL